MKKVLFSLFFLISAPALLAGKPTTQNNRLACILAAKTGDIETVRHLVEKGLVTHRTMNIALAEALAKNSAKPTDSKICRHTLVIEVLLDHGAIHKS